MEEDAEISEPAADENVFKNTKNKQENYDERISTVSWGGSTE